MTISYMIISFWNLFWEW